MNHYLTLINTNHWTLANIVMAVLGILIVEGFRILGRSSAPTTPRTKFSFKLWWSQRNNWLSPLLSLGCSMALLAMGPDASTYATANPAVFAFVAGACGQALIKVLINAAQGAAGLHGRATDNTNTQP